MIKALAGKNYSNLEKLVQLSALLKNLPQVVAPIKVYSAVGSGSTRDFESETGILKSSFAEDEFALLVCYAQGGFTESTGIQFNILSSSEYNTTTGQYIFRTIISRELWDSLDCRLNFLAGVTYKIATYRISQFAL